MTTNSASLTKTNAALPKSKEEAPFPLLEGVIVHCLEDIPAHDQNVIYAGTEVYGGSYCSTDLDESLVTHIVTLGRCEAYDSGIDRWIKKGIKVIFPDWFDHCFQLQLLCPADSYLFPNPPLLNMDLGDFLSSTSKVFPPVKESKPAPEPNLLDGKIFYFDPSIIAASADESQKSTASKLVNVVESLGAKVTDVLGNATSVIVETQGTLFGQALEMKKEIGTKKWIRDQIAKQKLLSPFASCLHYPHPPSPLVEMRNVIITVSNYVGRAREDIFQMAARLGATTTRSMTTKNTHLITACPAGEKYSRAHLWNMHIVNHLWIEDTYRRWVYQKEAKPKYVTWPICISQLVSQSRAIPRPFDVDSIAQSKTVTPGNRRLSKHDVETMQAKEKSASRQEIDLALSVPSHPAMDYQEIENDQEVAAADKEVPVVEDAIPKQASFTNGVAIVEHPKAVEVGRSLVAEEREVTADAFNNLIDEAMEINIFAPVEVEEEAVVTEAEKTVLQPIRGGLELANTTASEKNDKKRASVTLSPPPKKTKPNLKVMFTGIRPMETQKKAMKSLGVVVVDSIAETSLLIAHKIARTEKFLLAVTYGIPIVSDLWMKELTSRNQIPSNPEFYALIDRASEAEYGFQLSNAIAAAFSKKLLGGYAVFYMGKLEPDWKTVKRLVEAAGATFYGMVSRKTIGSYRAQVEMKGEEVICFCSSNDESAAKELGVKNAYSTELLLNGLLKQELDLDSYRLNDD